MKTIFTILLLTIVNICQAQTLTQKIANIRTEVQKINNGSGYRLKTLSNEQFLDENEMPDGGGELQGYYQDGKLIKVVEKIYLSSCIHIMECRFYYEDLKPIHSIVKGQTRCSFKPDTGWAKRYIYNVGLWKGKLNPNG